MTDLPEPAASVRSQWWLALCLTIAATVATIDRNVLTLLVEPIKADLHLTDVRMSVILGAAFALSYTAALIPAGWLADRFSRKAIVAGGIGLWSLMCVGCGLSTTSTQLFWTRVGVGAAEGSIPPSIYAMFRAGIGERRRGRAFSLLAVAPMYGAGLAVIIGGALASLYSAMGPVAIPGVGLLKPWQMTLFTVGLAGLPLGLLALTIREPARVVDRSAADAPGYLDALRYARTKPALYAGLFTYALANQMIGIAYAVWSPAMLHRVWGYSSGQISSTFGFLLLFGAPLGLLLTGLLIDRAGKVGDRRAPIWIALAVGIVITVTATATPLLHDRAAFWALFATQVILGGIPIASSNVVLANVTPNRFMAKLSAINLCGQGVFGVSLGPTLAAYLGDHLFHQAAQRSIGYGLSLMSIVAGTTAILCMVVVLRRSKRDGSAAVEPAAASAVGS